MVQFVQKCKEKIFMYFSSLTILTILKMTGSDVNIAGEIPFSTISYLLVAGWAAFLLSLVLSFIFYAVHPSQVDVFTLRDKLKVNICGYKLHLRGYRAQGNFNLDILDFSIHIFSYS